MSSLPLRFLESWQAKQFSLRMGATSLMKLAGLWAGAWAAAGGDINHMPQNAPRIAKGEQKQMRVQNMKGRTPDKRLWVRRFSIGLRAGHFSGGTPLVPIIKGAKGGMRGENEKTAKIYESLV